MKSSYLLLSVLLSAAAVTSCSSDNSLQTEPAETGNSVTFTLRTPGGNKVHYASRAEGEEIHESDEYAINSLALYEYEVTDEGTFLRRVLKKDGLGKNTIDLIEEGDNSYKFSIIEPADNDGKKYQYKFVANDAVADPEIGSSFDLFAGSNASLALNTDNQTADFFASEDTGIAMTGVATVGGNETIAMQKGLSCDVVLKRIVSRIDIKFETPNLKLTEVTLTGAPEASSLFPVATLPLLTSEEGRTLALNSKVTLLDDFLKNIDDADICELKKAFYLYERQNNEEGCVTVHIKYTVSANGLDSYVGSIDIPFRKTDGSGEYVNVERNHLYTIVLGNGKDPISGKVSAKLIVNEWTGVDIDEPLTEDDALVENE